MSRNLNWTREEVNRKIAANYAPKSKYRNVRCVVGGETFDSKAEGQYWLGLKLREAAKEITDLRRQIKFPLHAPLLEPGGDGYWHERGGFVHVADYVADFVWRENGELVVADKKGKRTREYLLKRKWLELQQGIVILEV